MSPLPARKRGRPPSRQPPARSQIVDATVQLLVDQPLSRPSLKAVAHAAGVTPALLHYHFGDLAGLMRSLLEERALPLLQPALAELETPQPDAAAALARFLSKWIALMLRHRWLAPCLMQAADPGPTLLPQAGRIVRDAVADAQRQGRLRADLPDSYIAMLLLQLGTMPHLARTSMGAGIDPAVIADAEHAAALTLRHLSVLQSGIAAPRAPPA